MHTSKPDESIRYLIHQLKTDPNNQKMLYQLSLLFFQNHQIDKAYQSIQHLLSLNSRISEAQHLLALIYLSQKKYQQALPHLQTASQLNPDNVSILIHLGNLYGTLKQLEPSISCFNKALEISPNLPLIWFNLGNSWAAYEEPSKAKKCFEKALKLNPEDYRVYGNLATIQVEIGELKEGFKNLEKAIELAPANQKFNFQCGQLFTHLYNPQMTAEDLWLATKTWGQTVEQTIPPLFDNHKNSPESERKLNIGYLSPAFCNHAASFYSEAYFKDWDKNLFTTFCYADVIQPDNKTRDYQQWADHFMLTAHLSDQELAKKIYSDKIDILIDPGVGHTQHNRMLLFALKPAPIQMTIYPTTIGLSRFDYRITDPHLDPPTEKNTFAETLVYLPDNIFYYAPPKDTPKTTAITPEKTNNHITFGCFNNLPKLNLTTLKIWSEILQALPQSKLLLKTRHFKDLTVCERYLTIFKSYGIESNRIILKKHSATLNEHLKLYHSIDIALDPFPYNGHTTTLEALLMGVPVIALRSQNHFGRVAANLLNTLDLSECVAYNCNDYKEKALAMASNNTYRSQLKTSLRSKLLNSPLCQRQLFVENLSKIYRQVWRKWCLETTSV